MNIYKGDHGVLLDFTVSGNSLQNLDGMRVDLVINSPGGKVIKESVTITNSLEKRCQVELLESDIPQIGYADFQIRVITAENKKFHSEIETILIESNLFG